MNLYLVCQDRAFSVYIKNVVCCAGLSLWSFLKPDFEILTFLNTFGLFWKSKKARVNAAFSGFFQSERLGSGKTLPELHIHYKSLLKRDYNHAGCTKYRKHFTVAPKLIDVIDEKQMYHNVIMWKENVSKEWNCITSMFLTSLMSILCLVMHILCVFALKLLFGFFWDKVWLF